VASFALRRSQSNPNGDGVEHDGGVGPSPAGCLLPTSPVNGSHAGWTRPRARCARCGSRSSPRRRRACPRVEFRSVVHRYYDQATEQFLSVDPLVNETGTPYSYTGGDPVNAVDPNGLGWCPLGHVNSNPNSGCRGSGALQEVSSVAGYVQLGADAAAAAAAPIPILGEVVTPVAAGVSEVAGAVSTVTTCADTFYSGRGQPNAVVNCYEGLLLYNASGGFASFGSAQHVVQFGGDLWSWFWAQVDASQSLTTPDGLRPTC